MRVWRISKRQYAPAVFSGNGGLRAAMRWNHKGHRIVYTSQSLSLATLELWVHTPPIEPLTTYVSVAAGIPDDLQITLFEQAALPPDWREDPAGSLRNLGTHWLVSKVSAVARVPSAIVPTEYNYLLNPEHPDFGLITIEFRIAENRWFAIGRWSPGARDENGLSGPSYPSFTGANRTTTRSNEIREEFATRPPFRITPSRAKILTGYALLRGQVEPGQFRCGGLGLDAWWLNRAVIKKDVIPPACRPCHIGCGQEIRCSVVARAVQETSQTARSSGGRSSYAHDTQHQRTCFTTHGSDHDGFRRLSHKSKRPRLVKILIPNWEIQKIRRSLESCGID